MRSLTAACLAVGFFFQIGCAMAPKMTTMRKHPPDSKAASQYLAARKLENQGKLEPAREIYESLLNKQPENPDYLHRQAVVCTRLQRFGEARSLYERARERDPKNVSLLSDMGYSSYLRGDLAEAEQLLRDAKHLKPSDKRTTVNLAVVVGCQGQIDESLSLLKEVENEPKALADLAYIHTRRGEYELAQQRYQAALDIDPNLKEAAQALAELSKHQPRQITNVAEATPMQTESGDFADTAERPTDPPLIQQVTHIAEDAEAGVIQAGFVVETAPSKEPERLAETHEIAGWAEVTEKLTTESEVVERIDVEPLQSDDASPAGSVSIDANSHSQDDDWDSDDRTTSNPTRQKSPRSRIVDEPIEAEEPEWMNQSTVPSGGKAKQLTFRPRRPQLMQSNDTSVDDEKGFATPTRNSDDTE